MVENSQIPKPRERPSRPIVTLVDVGTRPESVKIWYRAASSTVHGRLPTYRAVVLTAPP